MLRHQPGKEQITAKDGSTSNEIKFLGPKSLAFGGSKSDNIYFEVEFCGVNNEAFDFAALQDIHVGIHGTKGHTNAVWTVTWDKESLEKWSDQFFSENSFSSFFLG